MFTFESILQVEGWYALSLAIVAKQFLLPDDACKALSQGKCFRANRSWDEIVPEMIELRKENMPWREIAAIYGYGVDVAMSMATKWQKRQLLLHSNEDDIEMMAQMKQDGMTYKQIADVYGFADNTVYRKLKKGGFIS